MEELISKHGGYRNLITFQLARLVFDITVRFCNRFIGTFTRTHDQMVQAAHSGVQNIAEGSQASGTSKKTEIKLTNVARASLEELKLDYEDFLRQKNFARWEKGNILHKELVSKRFKTADEFAFWVRDVEKRQFGTIPEIAANGVITLLDVTCRLLDKQIKSQALSFTQNGGFTERMYRIRSNSRKN